MSACKQTFSYNTFILTPARTHKALLQRQNGSSMDPVLLDLVHSYTEWQVLPPITAQPAWLAGCGTSYTGSYHPMDSSHFHPLLWRVGEHNPHNGNT